MVVQLGPGQPPSHLVLAAENQRIAGVALAQQVLGVIELRRRKEARARHAVAIGQHRRSRLADHAAPFPSQAPESVAVLDRPAVQAGEIGEAAASPAARFVPEAPEIGRRDALGRRLPERRVLPRVHRFLPWPNSTAGARPRPSPARPLRRARYFAWIASSAALTVSRSGASGGITRSRCCQSSRASTKSRCCAAARPRNHSAIGWSGCFAVTALSSSTARAG